MNSFETDLLRAIKSKGFVIGLIAELVILFSTGWNSDLFRMCVPVLCTLPYSTAWLTEYQSGFLKASLSRTSITAYILGKILACGISGGLLEVLSVWLFFLIKSRENSSCHYGLLFLSGMLWAVLSALLAAWSNNRYIAYGGSFVIYYLMIILHERYFPKLYCLYPYEWLEPQHTWIFGEQGIVLLLSGLILILICFYYEILRRCIEGV
ncbi:MAG: hypothetical protein K2N24_10140 [Lachnospiraceae bacterium]|nr:hypothetical protein [Lachnospiraceae bacterium]